jgi:hypothetical protein
MNTRSPSSESLDGRAFRVGGAIPLTVVSSHFSLAFVKPVWLLR